MLRLAALLASLCLLAGCVTTGSQTVRALPPGKSLAVVSGLGDELAMRGDWLIQTGDNTAKVEVADWRIDGQVEDQLKSLLQAGGRFRLVDCTPDREALNAIVAQRRTWTSDYLPPVMQRLRADCDADLYLFVLPAREGLFGGGYGPTVRGYGLYRRSFLGSESAVAYTFLWLYLFDRSGAEPVGSALMRELHALDDHRALDPAHFPPEQKATARAMIERLLREHLPENLHALGMT
ncbi:hypothetical protein SAMN06265365_122105 [Tistlia consotensis]|uniref:Lipoprotein n=1 Tax=Tistlia consotensis USBA 355 TaxID=560819 RepID=A0A1Y6CGB6_9PROT|nr:hypothetical protein [Tistlia consotensis]SMF63412.1 hypothetical protein SAMN05428998_124105 [Tistlia consotensis USBA 355]SNR96149.1 hypothetical protein SAMN06265365_122105 [Tistlia consotensis]